MRDEAGGCRFTRTVRVKRGISVEYVRIIRAEEYTAAAVLFSTLQSISTGVRRRTGSGFIMKEKETPGRVFIASKL